MPRKKLSKAERAEMTELLSEGFHTAFRKASDHPVADQIWKLIRHDLPQDEWAKIIDFVVWGVWAER